jgi:hypothetical protein
MQGIQITHQNGAVVTCQLLQMLPNQRFRWRYDTKTRLVMLEQQQVPVLAKLTFPKTV